LSLNDNFKELLKKTSDELGIEINNEQLEKFNTYKDILIDWNSRINLTAIRNIEDITVKHYVDSLSCLLLDNVKKFNSFIDIGTGPGFPGLVIKIMKPEIKLIMLDSVGKKVDFVNFVIKELDLQNATAMKTRAEDLAQKSEYRENFECSITRGVGAMSIIAEYCLPFVKPGGSFIAMKGPGFNEELNDAKKAIEILGGSIKNVFEISLPENSGMRSLIEIEKIKKTPARYPRKAGMPSKSPIQ